MKVPDGYQLSRVFQSPPRKSGSYDYVKLYIDGDNVVFVDGVYDCCGGEPIDVLISISTPVPIGNAD